MVQTLDEPIKAKDSSSSENDLLKVGSSCMQNWRPSMEDAHTTLLPLPNDSKAAFFGVYDGHSGAKVSKYAAIHLHEKIMNNEFYGANRLPEAFQHGFLDLDKEMFNVEGIRQEASGSTAVTVLIKNNTIYCGNVGDSRAVSSIRGIARPLSVDHKPEIEVEETRITAAGGFVEYDKVGGLLSMSRVFGDYAYKRSKSNVPKDYMVTAFPEVSYCELTKDIEFIVLACDGIWDCMSNEEVVKFCRTRLQRRMEPKDICEELIEACSAPNPYCLTGDDNMTVILVLCMLGDSANEYCTRISRPLPESEEMNPFKMCTEVVPTACDQTFTLPNQS